MVVAAVLLFLAVAIFLRSKAPPEAARLLPESDGIVYINLKPVRAFFHKDLKPPERAAEYQQFIDAIGIDPERDLDEAAIALHRMTDPNGATTQYQFDSQGRTLSQVDADGGVTIDVLKKIS